MAEQAGQIAALFGDWPETLIWTCLEGTMGQIYVDNSQSPQSALALYGRQSFFAFLAGKPNAALLRKCEGKDIIHGDAGNDGLLYTTDAADDIQ